MRLGGVPIGRQACWYTKASTRPSSRSLPASPTHTQLGALQARLEAAHPAWVAFCHNDLQYGNMLLLRGAPTASSGCGCASAAAAAGADGQQPAAAAAGGGGSSCGGDAGQLSITLIDYEYSTLNDVAFDAANHFCEWAYNYHGGAPALFVFRQVCWTHPAAGDTLCLPGWLADGGCLAVLGRCCRWRLLAPPPPPLTEPSLLWSHASAVLTPRCPCPLPVWSRPAARVPAGPPA